MDILFQQDFALTQEHVRKNILLPFQTKKAYDRLVLCLHYSPKYIRDQAIIRPQIEKCVEQYFPVGTKLTEADMKEFQQLLNFVTISVDRDGEYIGCAHRHAPDQHITISAQKSTWGFAPTKMDPAEWRAVLHVQAVVVGQIDYRLVICGMEGGEGDDLLPTL